MTEDQIERAVERKTDIADHRLMAGECTQAEYDQHMGQINEWINVQYRALIRATEGW